MGFILITGATGHLGNNLMRALAKKGRQVRAGIHHSEKSEPFQGVEVEKVPLELLDRNAVREALKGVDIIYHAAAPNRIWDKKSERVFIQREKDATRNLLEEAKRAGVKKILFASSVFAAGVTASPDTPIDENSWYEGHHHPFFKAKAESEKLALQLAKDHDLDLVSLLPGLMAGPYAYHKEEKLPLMMDFIQCMLRNYYKLIPDYHFPIVDIRDVVDGMLLAEEKGKKGERYLLTADSLLSYEEIARTLGKGDQIILVPRKKAGKSRMVLQARLYALLKAMGNKEKWFSKQMVQTFWGLTPYNDNSKAKKELDWQPKKPILAARSAELWLQIDRSQDKYV